MTIYLLAIADRRRAMQDLPVDDPAFEKWARNWARRWLKIEAPDKTSALKLIAYVDHHGGSSHRKYGRILDCGRNGPGGPPPPRVPMRRAHRVRQEATTGSGERSGAANGAVPTGLVTHRSPDSNTSRRNP